MDAAAGAGHGRFIALPLQLSPRLADHHRPSRDLCHIEQYIPVKEISRGASGRRQQSSCRSPTSQPVGQQTRVARIGDFGHLFQQGPARRRRLPLSVPDSTLVWTLEACPGARRGR
jgi:hypothetical protein